MRIVLQSSDGAVRRKYCRDFYLTERDRVSLGGAAAFQDCVLNVYGHVTFANNTGFNGGALFMLSSQIILHPGSTVVFLGNRARGVGGAIFVWEHLMGEFIHVNNPDCFIAYSDPKLPPLQWKVSSIS